MARTFLHVLCSLAALSSVHAYFLVGVKNFITTQRLDPLVSPGKVASHAHSVLGGSNFGFEVDTATLQKSECTSMPINEDKSNYWFPHLYFQWANGTFTSLSGGAVIYYLFDGEAGKTTAFPDNLRMLSGDMLLRTYDPTSYAQQAVTFLCLDFNGVTTRHNGLPTQSCPSGIRAQINFPSCWNGKDLDSPDHKSHVAFRSGGPDSGDCTDPNFPVTLPRIFIEVYWNTELDAHRGEAMNTTQPYVYAHGDRTGYGYHADFINGWADGVLQKVVDNCHCNNFGDPQCCADQGLFTLNQQGSCKITDSIDEQTLGTLPKLPGNNPVQEEGTRATPFTDPVTPAIISPVYVYTGNSPAQTGSIVSVASTAAGGAATLIAVPSTAPSAATSAPVATSSSVSGSSVDPSESAAASTAVASGSSALSASGSAATDISGSGGYPSSASSASDSAVTAVSGSGSSSPASSASGSAVTDVSGSASASGSAVTDVSGSASASSASSASGSAVTDASGSASASFASSASGSAVTDVSGSGSSSSASSASGSAATDVSGSGASSGSNTSGGYSGSSPASGSNSTVNNSSSGSSGAPASGSNNSSSGSSATGSGSVSSSSASAASSCGANSGKHHNYHASPASGAAPKQQYKRRSLHKARHVHDNAKRFSPNDF